MGVDEGVVWKRRMVEGSNRGRGKAWVVGGWVDGVDRKQKV